MPTGVYKRTEYHKAILEKSRTKAVVASLKVRTGRPLSKEHREKISLAYDYEKHSKPEKGIKISMALTGRKLSLEHRMNISKVQLGKKMPPRTKEHRESLAVHHRGEKSHWWKGGKTELSKQIKNTQLYKDWRKAIFERDDYTCQFCKVRGTQDLAPDHIDPFSKILDRNNIKTTEEAKMCTELWNINNGRTLCHACHKTTDTYGWKIKNKKT